MRIEKEKLNEVSVVRVDGEVDLNASPDLRIVLLEELKQEDVSTLVLDLTGAPYIDSSGLAVLLEALRAARDQNTRFVVCGLSEEARGLLQLTRLLGVFEHYPTEEEALRALA